jgi:putative redox protein
MTDTDVEVVDLELVSGVSTKCVAKTEETDRAVVFHTDKPPEKGGQDKGPMSSELLAAAVASCHMTTAVKVAAKRRVPHEAMQCRSLVHFKGDEIERLELRFVVQTTGAPQDWETIMRLAARACTVGKTLKVPVEHAVEVQEDPQRTG